MLIKKITPYAAVAGIVATIALVVDLNRNPTVSDPPVAPPVNPCSTYSLP